MLELVTGGSGSGKSAYAEDRICELNRQNPAPLFYIATMYPYGEETKRKIERHRILREGKGFETLEWYTCLAEHLKETPLKGANVLLECMSNFVANELYMDSGAKEHAGREVLRGIRELKKQCANLVIVTNEVFSESVPDTEEMCYYKKVLGQINCDIAKSADQVTEVVYGLPQRKKLGQGEKIMDEKKEENLLEIILGGAFQGKTEYARKYNSDILLEDGAHCQMETIRTCRGMNRFHSFTRRWLSEGKTRKELSEWIGENHDLQLLITDEIGYGLVPIDDFEREYREFHGRIMTELVKKAGRVVRVVCGIPQELKN